MKKQILATICMLSIMSSMALITEGEFLRDCNERLKLVPKDKRALQCNNQYRRFLRQLEICYRSATEADFKNEPLKAKAEQACLRLVSGIQVQPNVTQPSALTKYH